MTPLDIITVIHLCYRINFITVHVEAAAAPAVAAEADEPYIGRLLKGCTEVFLNMKA